MSDLMLQFGASNLCISVALAIVAWSVQATKKRPLLAHLLWLLVLAKLVTPPILTIPIFEIPGLSTTPVEATALNASEPVGLAGSSIQDIGDTGGFEPTTTSRNPLIEHGETGLLLLWLLGSLLVLAGSLLRIYRFNRFLGMASEPAPAELRQLASSIARRLGLKVTPDICITTAHLSPMVWWVGGRVRVLLPAGLRREMPAGQFRWILAHELAHVRRRDHLVRWLEWLACVGFWWNPVAWWARRNLRINEEICCDALVLSSLNPEPKNYANSLLTAVEFLSSPALRPPAMASEINGGGFLERRFKMIVSRQPMVATPRWMHALLLLCALALLPLGVTYAQEEPDKGKQDRVEAIKERLRHAVENGQLTEEEARAKFAEIMKKAASGQQDREAGLAARFEKLGLNPKKVAKIREILAKNGLEGEQNDQAMGGIIRLAFGMNKKGKDFELGREVQGALQEQGIHGQADRTRRAHRRSRVQRHQEHRQDGQCVG